MKLSFDEIPNLTYLPLNYHYWSIFCYDVNCSCGTIKELSDYQPKAYYVHIVYNLVTKY